MESEREQTVQQETQQVNLKALAMQVLERSDRNTTCNTSATDSKKPCNKVEEFRAQKLRAVASQIIDVAHEIGVKPEVGLGFFSALDWEQLVDGLLGPAELRSAVAYAQVIQDQICSGVRLLDVSEPSRFDNPGIETK